MDEVGMESSDIMEENASANKSAAQLAIPLARVRRTIKLDPDVKNVSREAVSAITKLTEFFVQELSESAYHYASARGNKTIKGTDVGLAVHQVNKYDFLRADFPFDELLTKAASAATAAALKAKKQASSGASGKRSSAGATASIKSFFTSKRSRDESIRTDDEIVDRNDDVIDDAAIEVLDDVGDEQVEEELVDQDVQEKEYLEEDIENVDEDFIGNGEEVADEAD